MQGAFPEVRREGPGTSPGAVGGTGPSRSEVAHRVLVAFSSRFGNTERIAQALSRGLRRAGGAEVDCRSIDGLSAREILPYDLFALGGPTEIMSASAPMKEFLGRLAPDRLRGRRAFAFDTRLEGRLSGSAGRYIERHLEGLGMEIVRPHASALVRGMTKPERLRYGSEGAPAWVKKLDRPAESPTGSPPGPLDLLLPGGEAAFEEIGAELARALPVRTR